MEIKNCIHCNFSAKGKGSGIGLYMSKMIIERNMNGSITAKNIEGGVEFSVCTMLTSVLSKSAVNN